MAYLNSNIDVHFDGVQRTRAGLQITSEKIDKLTPLYTIRAARYAGEALKSAIDETTSRHETGNLRRAVYSDLAPTPLALVSDVAAGSGWQARAGISSKGIDYYTGRRDPRNKRTDPPIDYALAVSEGRRALVKPAGQFFVWYTLGSPKGFRKRFLSPRTGNHFIAIAQHRTEEYIARVLVPEFARRIGRSTTESRGRAYEEFIGYNPFSRI